MDAAGGNQVVPGGGTPVRTLPLGTLFSLLPKFDGRNIILHDWIGRLRSAIRIYNVGAELQTEIALAALEGDARKVVILRPEGDRNTIDKLVKILEDVYGEVASSGSLRAQFFARLQRENEDIVQYTNALQEILLSIQRKESDGVQALGSTDRVLRDQFVIGLYNPSLRRSLKERILVDPTLTFHQMQAEAVTRDQDENYTPAMIRTQQMVLPGTSKRTEILEDMVQELHTTVRTLREELTQARGAQIAPVSTGRPGPQTQGTSHLLHPESDPIRRSDHRQPRVQYPYRPSTTRQAGPHPSRGNVRSPEEKEFICWKCGGVGHFARDCPSRSTQPLRPPLNYRPLQ